MKKLSVIFFITISIMGCNQDKSSEEIREVMSLQEIAWNEGNIEQFMDGYWKSDSLMFISKNGIKYGWQTTLDNYSVSYPDKIAMGKLNFEILKLEVNGNSAYMLGKWKLLREEDTPNGHFTLYWKKIDGKWVITIDHTS